MTGPYEGDEVQCMTCDDLHEAVTILEVTEDDVLPVCFACHETDNFMLCCPFCGGADSVDDDARLCTYCGEFF
jgi:predicted CXXCH cytochrome family protein